jgi:hypothetical protein
MNKLLKILARLQAAASVVGVTTVAHPLIDNYFILGQGRAMLYWIAIVITSCLLACATFAATEMEKGE